MDMAAAAATSTPTASAKPPLLPKKPIRRREVGVDTSGQLDLVTMLARQTEAIARETEAAQPGPPPPDAPAPPVIRFKRRDPRDIAICHVRLDEYLKSVKVMWPFTVAKLLGEQDWKPFIARYSPDGRPAYGPEAMVGLIVAGLMEGIDTLRGLEAMARCNLGVMWLTGGICPDHSVIGRFIMLHETSLTTTFFAGVTASVLKATGSGVGNLAGDGTTIAALAARAGTLRAEALAAARREAEEKSTATAPTAVDVAAIAEADKLAAAEVELAKRVAAREAKGRDAKGLSIHPDEPEAVVQPQKDKTFAPSYKPTVLANAARVVVAADVHPSSETAVMPGLLDQAAVHGKVDTLLGDAGFNSAGMIDSTATRSIELLAPEGQTRAGDVDTAKQSDKQLLKSAFTYDAAGDSYRCPAGHDLGRTGQTREHTIYGGAPCADCPLRANCTTAKGGRQIKRYGSDGAKEAMRTKLAEPVHRQRYNKRAGMVEPVFAHLKVVQGLRRFRRRGLARVRLELMLHLAAYNLSRAVAYATAAYAAAAAAALICLHSGLFRRLLGGNPRQRPTGRRSIIRLPWSLLWRARTLLRSLPPPYYVRARH